MKKGLYTLFALVLVASMGLSLVPSVAAHGGGGHDGDHSMPTPPVSVTVPAPPAPCSDCQPVATPHPEEHHDEGNCGDCAAHPMPTISPMPTPQMHQEMEQHAVRTEAKYRGVMSHTMTSTLGTMVSAIEEATGMTVEEIMAARAEGESWSEIIAEGGATVEDVVAILIEAKAERLQTFVEEGVLSEEFVQQLLEMLALRWEAVLTS